MLTDRKRRSIRIKGYDYTGAGSYFVTICTMKRRLLFGEVISDKMIMNEIGDIVEEEWIRTSTIRRNVKLDVHMVSSWNWQKIYGLRWRELIYLNMPVNMLEKR